MRIKPGWILEFGEADERSTTMVTMMIDQVRSVMNDDLPGRESCRDRTMMIYQVGKKGHDDLPGEK